MTKTQALAKAARSVVIVPNGPSQYVLHTPHKSGMTHVSHSMDWHMARAMRTVAIAREAAALMGLSDDDVAYVEQVASNTSGSARERLNWALR